MINRLWICYGKQQHCSCGFVMITIPVEQQCECCSCVNAATSWWHSAAYAFASTTWNTKKIGLFFWKVCTVYMVLNNPVLQADVSISSLENTCVTC